METVYIALIGFAANAGGILLNHHLSSKELMLDANAGKTAASVKVGLDRADAIKTPDSTVAAPPMSRAAILSFISGLAGLFIFGLFAIVAIVAGYRAERNILELNGGLRGIGLARAGLVLGYLGGILLCVVAAMWATVGLT